jgi:hypothetical protein
MPITLFSCHLPKPTTRAASTIRKSMMSRNKISRKDSSEDQSFCLKVSFGGVFMGADYTRPAP